MDKLLTIEQINKELKEPFIIVKNKCNHIFCDGECIYCGEYWLDLAIKKTSPNGC